MVVRKSATHHPIPSSVRRGVSSEQCETPCPLRLSEMTAGRVFPQRVQRQKRHYVILAPTPSLLLVQEERPNSEFAHDTG